MDDIRKTKQELIEELKTLRCRLKRQDSKKENAVCSPTSLKQAEKRLRDSEELYRVTLENISDPIFITDDDGAFVFICGNVHHILGYTVAEIQAMGNIAKLVGDNFFDREALDRQGEIKDIEKKIVDEHSRERIFLITVKRISIQTGTILYTMHDITERKMMEENLRTSEAKLSNAMEIAKLGYWEYDVDADLFTFNDQFYSIFRTSADKVGGYTMSSADYAQRFLHPDDMQLVALETKKALETTDPHFSRQLEHRISYDNGEPGYISVRFFIVKDDKGRTIRTYGANQDITERKQREKALHESQRSYAIAEQIGNFGHWSRNFSQDTGVWSEGMYGIFGVNPDDFQSNYDYFLDLIHPADREPLQKSVEASISGHKPLNVEYRIIRPDGKERFVHSIAEIQFDHDGLAVGLFGVCQDISERKQAEKKLIESEIQVRKKLDSVLDPKGDIGNLELADIIDVKQIQSLMDDFYKLTGIGIGILDLRGNVLISTGWQDVCTKFHRVHPEACKHCLESDLHLAMGVKPGEFILYKCKNNMWDIATPIMIGDKHMGNLFLGQFFFENELIDYEVFRAQAKKYGFDEQEYLKALGQVPRWSHKTVDTVMKFYTNFADLFSLLSYSNIRLARLLEEQKNAEMIQRNHAIFLRTLLETIPFPFFYKDPGGRYTGCNTAFEKFIGKPRDQVIGKTVFEVYDREPKEVPRKYFEMDQKLFEHPGIQHYEGKMVNASGELRNIIFDKATIMDEDGSVDGLVGIMTDITEKKIADEKIDKYHERLRELASQLALAAENERRRFADELHDVTGQNLALAKIKLAELRDLTGNDDTEQRRDRLNYVLQLIDEAVVSTRSLTFELSPPILYELGFEATAEWLGEQILKRYDISFSFEDDRQPKPLADDIKVLLYLSLRELVVNIAKHSKARNATLSVRREGDNLSVSVSDDGVGFDASDMDHQIMKAASFGLFSTRERLEKLGGHLTISSQPGQGTTVTMVVPLKNSRVQEVQDSRGQDTKRRDLGSSPE